MKEIKIGNQIWTAENMAVTVDKDGNELVQGRDYYYPNNNEKLVEKYGLLYTWDAAMRIAPKGWHLPTDDEWAVLENYCSANYDGKAAKSLASTTGWSQCIDMNCIGYDMLTNNATGFSALPAGYYYGGFYLVGNRAYLWSATPYGSNYAYGRVFRYYGQSVYRDYDFCRYYGLSVRLVKDED